METLPSNKISEYLDANKLLSSYQYGVRSERFTLSQLLLVNAKFIECINNRACVDSVYTGMSKAFDCISHTKFVMKEKAYGINYYVCQWIADFLSDRSQRVAVNKCMSNWLNRISSVQQGSILRPLLFNIYKNDLTDCVCHSDTFLYADDT